MKRCIAVCSTWCRQLLQSCSIILDGTCSGCQKRQRNRQRGHCNVPQDSKYTFAFTCGHDSLKNVSNVHLRSPAQTYVVEGVSSLARICTHTPCCVKAQKAASSAASASAGLPASRSTENLGNFSKRRTVQSPQICDNLGDLLLGLALGMQLKARKARRASQMGQVRHEPDLERGNLKLQGLQAGQLPHTEQAKVIGTVSVFQKQRSELRQAHRGRGIQVSSQDAAATRQQADCQVAQRAAHGQTGSTTQRGQMLDPKIQAVQPGELGDARQVHALQLRPVVWAPAVLQSKPRQLRLRAQSSHAVPGVICRRLSRGRAATSRLRRRAGRCAGPAQAR